MVFAVAPDNKSKETPVVRLFFCKMKTAFLNLPDQDKFQFMSKDRANLDALGMKAISMIDCSTMDNEWDYIGVEGWPSMETIEKREQFEAEELKLADYIEYKTILGHEMSYENYGSQRPG